MTSTTTEPTTTAAPADLPAGEGDTNSGAAPLTAPAHPDDFHDFVDEGPWSVRERWLITEGVEVTRILAEVPAEIRLGDLNQYATRSEATLMDIRNTGRCLRIIADSSRIFVALPENVIGVYVELLTPYGDVVEYLHPGYIDSHGPVDRDNDEDDNDEGDREPMLPPGKLV